jgi:hypothetical protein
MIMKARIAILWFAIIFMCSGCSDNAGLPENDEEFSDDKKERLKESDDSEESDDSDAGDKNPFMADIIGQWKLIKVKTTYRVNYQYVSEDSVDYSHLTVIYDFRTNNKLIVTGYTPDDLSEGDHFYDYIIPNVCPTCTPGPNLYIDNNEPVFCSGLINENKMTIKEEKITGKVVDENGLALNNGEIIWTSKTFVKLN